jgi:hypothetical protein
MAKVNYTPEMVAKMTEMYEELGNDGLEQIAEAVNRGVRSVRAKLVREGVYVAPEAPVKEKLPEGPTKKELLNELESLVGLDLTGLMGANKEAISALISHLQPQDE